MSWKKKIYTSILLYYNLNQLSVLSGEYLIVKFSDFAMLLIMNMIRNMMNMMMNTIMMMNMMNMIMMMNMMNMMMKRGRGWGRRRRRRRWKLVAFNIKIMFCLILAYWNSMSWQKKIHTSILLKADIVMHHVILF